MGQAGRTPPPTSATGAGRHRAPPAVRRHPLLRDAALATVAVAAVTAVYVAARPAPILLVAAVLGVSTAAAMHARLAMGRWRAAAQLVAGVTVLVALGAPPRLVGVALLTGLVGAELVSSYTRRAAILQAGAWTAIVAGIASLSGFAAAVALPRSVVLAEALAAMAGAFLSAPVMLTVGPAAEWLFGHTTRLTMSEWLGYEHPLLRELASAAPGTFQHSVNVGVLADAATRAIGGDVLIARVGGLYHDVGKTRAPEYFSENQRDENPHDSLDPRESAAILRAHVSDGVEMIAAHRMGERIADFVREHHGTGTMRLLQARAEELGLDPASPDDFRYPGPRPRSRETGIVMVADQLEATARADPPRDEAACDALVRRTLDRILGEGELADSGLTGRELGLIRPAFARALQAMYHRRLTYPPSGAAPRRRRLAFVPRMLARGRSGV